jgi:hypothetical protein
VPANGGDVTPIELPAYAVRYLRQMCQRERHMLNTLLTTGGNYNPAIDAAFDSLSQIEHALP